MNKNIIKINMLQKNLKTNMNLKLHQKIANNINQRIIKISHPKLILI